MDFNFIKLDDERLNRLREGAMLLKPQNYNPYLTLRGLRLDTRAESRAEFLKLFSRYYGLNAGGLTTELKALFFERLFSLDLMETPDPYEAILLDLHRLPRRNGRPALLFSFVSKLVSIHDEERPIFDRHVRRFFSEVPSPRTGDPIAVRIEVFKAFLGTVRGSYGAWIKEEAVKALLKRTRTDHEDLRNVHDFRVLDLLVWKWGNHFRKQLARKPTGGGPDPLTCSEKLRPEPLPCC